MATGFKLRALDESDWQLATRHRNALAEFRRLNPEIPLTGLNDIPLRDEIELELLL